MGEEGHLKFEYVPEADDSSTLALASGSRLKLELSCCLSFARVAHETGEDGLWQEKLGETTQPAALPSPQLLTFCSSSHPPLAGSGATTAVALELPQKVNGSGVVCTRDSRQRQERGSKWPSHRHKRGKEQGGQPSREVEGGQVARFRQRHWKDREWGTGREAKG